MKQDLFSLYFCPFRIGGTDGCSQAQKQEAPNLKRPNVIFIYSETWVSAI